MLPDGTMLTCSGILRMYEDTKDQNMKRAIAAAEEAVGSGWSDEKNRKLLIRMIELNLVNRKENDRETLNRRYGLQVTHTEFWREKGIFCRVLISEMQILALWERNRNKQQQSERNQSKAD